MDFSEPLPVPLHKELEAYGVNDFSYPPKRKEVINLLHRTLLLVFALHKDQPLLLSLQIIHMALQFVVEYCESVIEGSIIRHIAQRS